MTPATGRTKGTDPRTMLLVLGICYVVFAGFGLLMSFFQTLLMDHMAQEIATRKPDFDLQSTFASQLHGVWRIHLPIVMVIGLLYVGFAWRLPRLTRGRIGFSQGLAWLSGLCAVSYVVRVAPLALALGRSMPGDVFRAMSYASGVSGGIFCLALATIPQILIHRKLKALP